ncbi:MAG: hypothetical protein AAF750_11820 [Planctomycetota bacterium]
MAAETDNLSPEALGIDGTLAGLSRVLWLLVGRSALRLVVVFVLVAVLMVSPTLLLIAWLYADAEGWSRTGVVVVAVVWLLPVCGVAAFNYTTYRVLAEIVQQLALGRLLSRLFLRALGQRRVAAVAGSDFDEAWTGFAKRCVADARQEKEAGFRGDVEWLGFRATLWFVGWTVKRLARRSMVDGRVDLDRFADSVGERIDDEVIRTLRSLLWDITRLVLGLLWVLLLIALWALAQLLG